MWDILIRNGLVIDGTGKERFAADVAVKDGKIAKIAPKISGEAWRTIDAAGCYVTPGFIDMHSHGDCTAPLFPDMDGTLAQGVTTLFAGHCGLGLAPVDKYWLPMFPEIRGANRLTGSHDWLIPGYTTLVETEAFRPILKELYGLDADWHTFGEFLDHLANTGIGANMLCVVGHAQLRQQVLGYDSSRPATDQEIKEMCALLRREMEAGAPGFSVGLDYAPGVYCETKELTALAAVAAEYNGIMTAHVRGANSEYQGHNIGVQPIDGMRELLDIGAETRVHVHISHICPGFKVSGDDFMREQSARRTIQIIEEYRERGVHATWDVIPVNGLFYLPELATKLTPYISLCGGKSKFAQRLRDCSYRDYLSKEIKEGKHLSGTGFCRVDPTKNPCWADQLEITKCAVTAYIGKTLSEIARDRDMDPVDAMLDILQQDMDTCATPLKTAEDRIDPAIAFFLSQRDASLAFDGAAYNLDSVDEVDDLPRIYGAPATYSGMVTFLLKYRARGLEENVKCMTGNAAKTLGLRDRGFLAEGMAADVVVFNYDALDDRIGKADPRNVPTGINYVLVNGVVAAEQGVLSRARSGAVLRRDQIHTSANKL